MKHEIEKKLTQHRTIMLSNATKATIKSTLLQHAQQSLLQEIRPVRSPWNTWFMRSAASSFAVLCICIGTAYASTDSLPGEPLYALKVTVVEELVGLVQITPLEKISYTTDLLEQRLIELQYIKTENNIADESDIDLFAAQIQEHVNDVTNTLAGAPENNLSYESQIESLSKLQALTGAHATLIEDSPQLLNITSTLEETYEATSDILETTVIEFVSNTEMDVTQTYLSEQLADIETNLATAPESIEQQLTIVNTALTDGEIGEAILSALEVQEEITTTELIETHSTE